MNVVKEKKRFSGERPEKDPGNLYESLHKSGSRLKQTPLVQQPHL